MEQKYFGMAPPGVEAVAATLGDAERGDCVRIMSQLLSPGWLLASKAACLEVRQRYQRCSPSMIMHAWTPL